MTDWITAKQRHDTLLEEFRARSARSRAIHEEGAVRHTAQQELVEAIRRRQNQLHLNRLAAKHQAKERSANKAARQAYDSIAAADENLKRLGLDEQSVDQQKQFSIPTPQPPTFVMAAPSQALAADFPQSPAMDDAMSGRASAYSRKSRRAQGGASAANGANPAHPLVGGVASLLRNANAAGGNSDVDAYALKGPIPRAHERVKLAPPSAHFPTVSKPLDADGYPQTDSSGEEEWDGFDPEDIQRGDAYMEAIRAKKQEDVAALRERQVRQHRLRSEQMRSRTEVSEKKELDQLIKRTKLLNAPDKQRAIDDRICGILKERLHRVKDDLHGAARRHIARVAEIELDRNALVANNDRMLANAEFQALRKVKQEEETQIALGKHLDRVQFCEELARGIVQLAEAIVDKSTHQMHDGTCQYRRATFGASEWHQLKRTALRTHNKAAESQMQNQQPPNPRGKDVVLEAPANTLQRHRVETPLSGVVPASSDAMLPAVLADEKWAVESLAKDAREACASKNSRHVGLSEMAAIFLHGDPVLSGTALLHDLAPFIIPPPLENAHKYVLMTPRLLQHMYFEQERRGIDQTLDNLISQRNSLQLEVSKNVGPSAKASKKDAKRDPLANSPLASQLNEINMRITSLQADRDALLAKAADEALNPLDGHSVGALLGRFISRRFEARDGDDHDDTPWSGPTPLTLELFFSHVYLQPAVLICVGFPHASDNFCEAFACELQKSNTLPPLSVVINLTCTTPTLLRRLNERELYWQTVRTPQNAAPVQSVDESSKKKKGATRDNVNVGVVAPPPPPATPLICHPILSPLSLGILGDYNGEATISNHLMGDTLEKAVSPFSHNQKSATNLERCVFVRGLSWRDECQPDEIAWLRSLCLSQGAHDAAPRNQEIIRESHLTVTIDDFTDDIFDGIQLPPRCPGEELSLSELDILRSVRARLAEHVWCALGDATIVDEKASSDLQSLSSTIESGASLGLREPMLKMRMALAKSFEALQKGAEQAFCELVAAANRYRESTVTHAVGSFERLHVCDEERRSSTNVLKVVLSRVHDLTESAREECEWNNQKIKEALVQFCGPEVMVRTLNRIETSLVDAPFALITRLESHLNKAASEWTLKLFNAFTHQREEDPAPRSIDEMLSLVDVRESKCLDSASSPQSNPTLIQSATLSDMAVSTMESATTAAEYRRFMNLVVPLQRVAPAFLPASVQFLVEHPPACGHSRDAITLAILTNRLGLALGLPQIPFANALQVNKFAESLKSRTHFTLNEFEELEWWIPANVVQNISTVLLNQEHEIVLNSALHFVCGNSSQNTTSILNAWTGAISCHLGAMVGTDELTLNYNQMAQYFPLRTFQEEELKILDILENPSGTTQHLVIFRHFQNSALGRELLRCAPLQQPQL